MHDRDAKEQDENVNTVAQNETSEQADGINPANAGGFAESGATETVGDPGAE